MWKEIGLRDQLKEPRTLLTEWMDEEKKA